MKSLFGCFIWVFILCLAVSTSGNAQGAPAAPQNLFVITANSQTTLRWNRNNENDFLRYRIYGGTSPNPTTKIDST